MARNGSGTYNRVAGTPYVFNTVADEVVVNSEFDDIATALTNSLAKNGETTPTANLPLGNFKLTSVGAGTDRTDAAQLAQVQNSSGTLVGSIAGTNTITGTCTPVLTAYTSGQQFVFVPAATSTGAVTINIDTLGAKDIFFEGVALTTGMLVLSVPAFIVYDGTQFNLVNHGNIDLAISSAAAQVGATLYLHANFGGF